MMRMIMRIVFRKVANKPHICKFYSIKKLGSVGHFFLYRKACYLAISS